MRTAHSESSRRRPSSRSRPAAPSARSTLPTSPRWATSSCSRTRSTSSSPRGPERIAELGGFHRFAGWERALITDSGGFQVFSLAHGGSPTRSRGGAGFRDRYGVLEIAERGVRFRPTRRLGAVDRPGGVDGSAGGIGSDIALAFDECTPYHADRDYTARSAERTHRWLDRCLDWHEREGPERQAVFGIVQGGVHDDLRRDRPYAVSAAGVDGLSIGGTLGRDKPEMRGVLELTGRCSRSRHRSTSSGSGSPRPPAGIGLESTSSTARCRPGSPGKVWRWRPLPEARYRFDLTRAGFATDEASWSRAVPAPPAPRTPARTSTTWAGPSRRPRHGC